MPTSLIEGNSLLALDIGTTTTRASYFDVVDGRYRFIAVGHSPTTAAAPVNDLGQGVRQAIAELEVMIGRTLMDQDKHLILPAQPEGTGVDNLVSTLSAGPSIKTVVFGLLSEVSLESVQKLARSTYSRVVDSIGMNDKRLAHEQVDTILRQMPDLILISGGTEGGASHSMKKILEVVGLSCYLMSGDKRPAVLYAGNQELADEVKSSFEKLVPMLHFSPNIRPSLEIENLEPAEKELATMYPKIRQRQIMGVDEISALSGGKLFPTAFAQGRMIRFLSNISEKGILNVDLGASSTTVSGAMGGRLSMNVFPQFGLGEPLSGLLRYTTMEEAMQWLTIDLSADAVRDFIYLKSLYPATIPATPEELAIEQALARHILFLAVRQALGNLPKARPPRAGLMPNFDPIFASGSIFAAAPTLGQSLLMLLDAIQPTGFSTFMLDQNNLLGILGAAAEVNTILPIHVIESGAFVNLGAVISPLSNAGFGTPILRVRLTYDNGEETTVEVKQGAMEIIPLVVGRTGNLRLEPVGRTDAGIGFGRAYRVDGVQGSALGVVIDARGRPLRLPSDAVKRRELLKKWLWNVGG
jgi:uncharacterized protein (TIGR01319 family)